MTQPTKKPRAKPGPSAAEERVALIRQPTEVEAVMTVRDRTVLEYDARWGTDVLQTLVGAETAAKFAIPLIAAVDLSRLTPAAVNVPMFRAISEKL